jgi:hypothetical protein
VEFGFASVKTFVLLLLAAPGILGVVLFPAEAFAKFFILF